MEIKVTDFKSIILKLASPEKILSWSRGEVTKAETINYRTQRAERDGLFDERIFGPEKDYECYCGKYRRIRYKGIVCEKCGVEVTRSIVRRERMGHLVLASPVSHIWYFRGIPSVLGLLLNLSVPELEKVIYFASYIITKVNEKTKLETSQNLDKEYKAKSKNLTEKEKKVALKAAFDKSKNEINDFKLNKVISEVEYHRLSLKYGDIFEAEIGSEALFNICKKIDLNEMRKSLMLEAEKTSNPQLQKKFLKQISLIKAMERAGIRPEWMFLTALPIIPPAFRPMVQLDGGRHATSDVNDLYRRVINRNNRLKKLIELKAPEVICRNEKRMLQEAVDALIDNSIRRGQATAVSQAQRRPLRSLADMLRGKQGRFRQNLLGKRVDYSGRSVIVVGPELKMHQCGLPKHMALELFKPFVISKLIKAELAYNIRGAGRLIDDATPDVWAALEEVIKDKYVLLNRAPTLHRLGIQAFQPILIEGNAIQIHPLVCAAFNADFDGDQMAVHVPLSDSAQKEAKEIMASVKNLLGPGTGEPIVNPSQDIVFGCYWMTKTRKGTKGEGKIFSSPNEAITAYDFGYVDLQAQIKVLITPTPKYQIFTEKLIETTVGRLLFNSVLPSDFEYVNEELNKKKIAEIVKSLIKRYGVDATPPILDKIKEKDQQVLVFDFGAGTLDVTIMNFGQGVFEVRSTSGNTQLGGTDMDEVLIDYIIKEFKKDTGIDLKNDKMAMQRIKEAGEKAKIELSSVLETEINLPFITADSKGPKHLLMKITRAKLEELVRPIVEKCQSSIERALGDAKLNPSEIEKVILVGGPTRMPMVQKFIENIFGQKIERGVDPMECVAMGAAIQGAILAGESEVKDVLLLDVTPLTLGIETLGNVMTPLIERNTTIPTSKSQIFSTAADSQPSVEIHVLQGERPMAQDNRTLGRFMLDGIPPAPRGIPQIEVTFDIDANGILMVTAKDKATNRSQNITIKDSSALSKEEIEKMKKQAEKFSEEDRKKRDLIDARNMADTLAYTTEKTIKDFGGKIKSEDKKEIEEKIAALKKVKDSDDIEAIKKASDELSQAIQKVGTELYKAQQEAQKKDEGPDLKKGEEDKK